MQQDILVSVIVPVYNVESYLCRCVDSILNQTYRNLEVILVDDGATDASGAICDDYAGRDDRVRVIHKENGGLSSARNAGIDVARGTYLEFVDSDDWLEPDGVESLLSLALEQNTELVAGGRYDVNAETGERKQGLCPTRTEVISGEELVSRIFRWDNCDSSACDKLFHKRLFRQIRFPLGVVCEDVPVMYLIALDAGRAAMLDKPIYNYYHRHGSISTEKVITDKTFHFSQHTEKILPYIEKHHPAIAPEARYLRLRSLIHALLLLDQAGPESRKQYREISRQYRLELRRNGPIIVSSSLLGRQEKLTALLLGINAYRIFRRIYHGIR
ncbi:MAG: glycosyltransferase [Oscillospiraceae bacterium]|nr:glycosyltransferase [Oscillospiraceae bacterium]MBQ7130170.1 glycosyltransferase [Oscillospiraceae bacterium]